MPFKSLLEEHNHGVADVQAYVAAIVMRYRMTTFLDYETVPISLISSIELFFDFTSDIWEMTWVVILECS